MLCSCQTILFVKSSGIFLHHGKFGSLGKKNTWLYSRRITPEELRANPDKYKLAGASNTDNLSIQIQINMHIPRQLVRRVTGDVMQGAKGVLPHYFDARVVRGSVPFLPEKHSTLKNMEPFIGRHYKYQNPLDFDISDWGGYEVIGEIATIYKVGSMANKDIKDIKDKE